MSINAIPSFSREKKMNLRSLTLLAAVLLVAACAEDQTNKSDTTGTATSAGPQTTTTAQPGSEIDLQQNVGDRVFFDYDRTDIKPEGRQVLERQADWLKKYAN